MKNLDKVAKKASTIVSRLQDSKVQYSDLFCQVRVKVWENWQDEYQTSVTGKWYRNIQPSVARKPSFVRWCRSVFTRVICRLKTRDAWYPEYRNRFSLSSTHSLLYLWYSGWFAPCFLGLYTIHIETNLSLDAQRPFNLHYLLTVSNTVIYRTFSASIK